MACLNITNGLFINAGPSWQSGNTSGTTANGATVTNTTSGGSPGCTVVKGGSSVFFPQPAGGSTRFFIFGNPANFVAVLTIQGGVGSVMRTVNIVDVSGATVSVSAPVMQLSAASSVSLPAIDPSQGNGSVFMVSAGDGSGALANIHAAICRSDNGTQFCSVVPFTPSQQILGNATATQLQILEGGTVVASAARPRGNCNVTTDPLNFPDAVLGPGVSPTLGTSTRTATIRNDGNDCLTINSIGFTGPYSFVSSTPAMPATLDPGAQLDIVIRFAPGAVGTFNLDLPIVPAPTLGDTVIRCRGVARPPVRTISFPATRAFGSVPVTTASTLNVTIANTGEADVAIVLPGSSGTSDFGWPAASVNIAPGASAPAIPVTFQPTVEGAASDTITFTSNATGSPHTVQLSGSGCVPRAQLVPVVPPGPSIAFGQVQRGFRMVRVVRVQNPGNGPLSFRSRTLGNALFGIQRIGDSITAPLSDVTLTVAPPTICGAGTTGPGQVEFAVTFFANAAPGLQSAQLVLDNHNASTGPASFTFTLEAEVIAAVNADVELVLDRSGSMNDSSGPRRKVDVALDAARLFVQLGRPDVDDRIGTSRFNTVPEQVQAITAITSANQASMVGSIVEANFAPSGGTSIAGGVLQAAADLDSAPRPTPPLALNKAIVVLTDANDNTPFLNPADGVSYTLLGENGTSPVPVPAGVRLYGVGIGDDVDVGRLAQLCPATGGQFLHVRNFNGLDFFKLEKHFTQIYMATVDLAQINDPTFWLAPNSTHEHRFSILRGDVTFMVVIFDRDGVRLPFWLESPTGEIVELTTVPAGFQIRPGITNTARFLEVRLPQGEPDRYAGEWKAVIAHNGKNCVLPGIPSAAVWHDGGTVGQGSPAIGTHSNASSGAAQGHALTFGFSSTRCKANPNDPVMYGIALGAGSNFRMFPFVEPGIVTVGDPIRLNALVSEFGLPVTNCQVTVEAKTPGGTLYTLLLHDDGTHRDGAAADGDYGGLFTHTQEEGMHEFLFRAVGTSRDGEPVTREAVLSKWVEGRDKLVPTDPVRPGGGSPTDDKCCSRLERWLRILAILLAILVLAVLLS
jgi:Abnormal spindle-like microcephaly-assoc'd, ASPM-SPD-2-Hydin/von Willebrand factor type A domain